MKKIKTPLNHNKIHTHFMHKIKDLEIGLKVITHNWDKKIYPHFKVLIPPKHLIIRTNKSREI